MMQQVYDVLQEEYDRQKQEGFCTENVDGMTNFVFTNRFGMPHNPAAVNRAIKRIVDTHNSEEEVAAKKEKRESIMIPRFSCHIFRHTFASRFCENETNIKVIQEVMGHADVSTTMNIYAEANPDVMPGADRPEASLQASADEILDLNHKAALMNEWYPQRGGRTSLMFKRQYRRTEATPWPPQ